MSNRSAVFDVIQSPRSSVGPLIIKDIGPWNKHLTITNDAETVVEKLLKSGALKPGQQLLYYDSENELTELVIKDGKFAGFAPVSKKQEEELFCRKRW